MPEFRVLTTKEQTAITGLLEKANAALVAANAIVAGQPVEKKARKPRKAKVAAEAPQAKRRGRPPKTEVAPAAAPAL